MAKHIVDSFLRSRPAPGLAVCILLALADTAQLSRVVLDGPLIAGIWTAQDSVTDPEREMFSWEFGYFSFGPTVWLSGS